MAAEAFTSAFRWRVVVGVAVDVVFDTDRLPARDRESRMRVELAETSRSSVTMPHTGGPVNARLDVWQLGRSYLFRAETSSVRMFRTERQARQEPVPLLALAVQERGAGLHEQFTPLHAVRPGEMMGMDMTEPYAFAWQGQGASRALMMPLEDLDLPPAAVRHAVPRLTQSPLCGLMSAHVVSLFAAADALVGTPSTAAGIERSTLALARALVGSVSPDETTRRAAGAETLLARVRDHIRHHIRDPGLSAESIARAHGISLRQLYKVCAAGGVSLEQLIIRRRLHGARAELSLPAAQRRSIESVARSWGFRNVTHFSRRFRQEFDVSPREWRAASSGADPGPR